MNYNETRKKATKEMRSTMLWNLLFTGSMPLIVFISGIVHDSVSMRDFGILALVINMVLSLTIGVKAYVDVFFKELYQQKEGNS